MPNIWQTPISSAPDSKPGRYSGRGDVVRAKVDLSEVVPPLQESVRQSQALDAQRSQQDTVEQAPTRSM
ncbi:hypothetical protein XarbCFBP7408_12095 [Xanthomonas arboricola pv. guizotiae]|uniref:Uncharacterized protein n=1 Tax=Xanthomonas arboricola pv. guizotiae TaxID=487867 RepID=A0A2S7A2V3_9XANT|nr:hypothetical protein XarbCFBP7409_09765 [Xanthomonas arboricola pv. guizotiae]PPU23175.1 hypothetical protein XarbCFBP7408_12095 [Xanthomonas arboricola pv. guizotiae]